MTRERRLQTRETPAELAFIQINRDDGGRILNISESGLCFETFGAIERVKQLRFWFSLDLYNRVEAIGKLAWLNGEKKIGGLRFSEMSAKAQRHVRAYLKAARQEAAPAFGSAFLAVLKSTSAERAAKEQEAGYAQAVDVLAIDGAQTADGLRTTGRAEAAERAASPYVLPVGLGEERSETPAAADNGDADRPVESLAAGRILGLNLGAPVTKRPSLRLIGMVPLERYRTTRRREFVRGILLGIAATLAVTVLAGKYLGRLRIGSDPGRSKTVSDRATAGPPATPMNAAPATGQSAAIAPKSAARQASSPRYSPDNPGPADLGFVPSRATPKTARDAQRARAGSSGSDAKLSRKSSATPQQLWLAMQHGSSKAAVELANRFLQGDGVPMNCDQARVLLLFASEKNNAEAIREMRELTKTGCPKAPGASVPAQSPTKDPSKP